MHFHRIDKNTVQCRMTEEEMAEYGFQIEDFFTDQEKSRAFLEQIVERAEEEIGYEVQGEMVSMQLMRMPDNSLTITFSDHGEDGLQSMINHIQQLAGMIDDHTAQNIVDSLKNELDQEKSDENHINMRDFMNNSKKNKNSSKKSPDTLDPEHKKNVKNNQQSHSAKVFSFASFSEIESFAKSYPSTSKKITSRVYRDNQKGTYYLLIKKGKLKFEEYQDVCNRLMDYGHLCMDHPYVEQYCKEHYECLISKQAITVMRDYY